MLKGIEIRDDGNFYKITKAESLSEVERRTRELKNKLSCYGAQSKSFNMLQRRITSR